MKIKLIYWLINTSSEHYSDWNTKRYTYFNHPYTVVHYYTAHVNYSYNLAPDKLPISELYYCVPMVFSIVFCYIFECILLATHRSFKVFDHTLSCSERQNYILLVYKWNRNLTTTDAFVFEMKKSLFKTPSESIFCTIDRYWAPRWHFPCWRHVSCSTSVIVNLCQPTNHNKPNIMYRLYALTT